MTKISSCRKVTYLILIGLLLCNLTGCMLLPKEEELKKVSFVKSDILDEYSFVTVERMDLEKSLNISCVYRQMQEEYLSFHVDDKEVEGVYVKIGDSVKKGSLLASLRVDELKDEINALEDSIEQIKHSISELKLKAKYDKEYVELEYKYSHLSKVEREQKILEIDDNLKSQLEGKENEITIKNLRLKEKQEILVGSKILAPIDGVVSYIMEDLENSKSQDNLAVIKMLNPEKCAFEIYNEGDASYLKVGEEYKVESEGITYEGTILPLESKKQSFLYLQPKETFTNMEVGQQGQINFVVESRKNVLALPNNVVHKAENYYFVYVIDEENIKRIKRWK